MEVKPKKEKKVQVCPYCNAIIVGRKALNDHKMSKHRKQWARDDPRVMQECNIARRVKEEKPDIGIQKRKLKSSNLSNKLEEPVNPVETKPTCSTTLPIKSEMASLEFEGSENLSHSNVAEISQGELIPPKADDEDDCHSVMSDSSHDTLPMPPLDQAFCTDGEEKSMDVEHEEEDPCCKGRCGSMSAKDMRHFPRPGYELYDSNDTGLEKQGYPTPALYPTPSSPLSNKDKMVLVEQYLVETFSNEPSIKSGSEPSLPITTTIVHKVWGARNELPPSIEKGQAVEPKPQSEKEELRQNKVQSTRGPKPRSKTARSRSRKKSRSRSRGNSRSCSRRNSKAKKTHQKSKSRMKASDSDSDYAPEQLRSSFKSDEESDYQLYDGRKCVVSGCKFRSDYGEDWRKHMQRHSRTATKTAEVNLVDSTDDSENENGGYDAARQSQLHTNPPTKVRITKCLHCEQSFTTILVWRKHLIAVVEFGEELVCTKPDCGGWSAESDVDLFLQHGTVEHDLFTSATK